MAKSSINFQKVSIHSFCHNDRTETKKANTIFKDLSKLNKFDISAKEAQKNFNELYKNSINKITGKIRRAHKKNTLIEAVVNIKTNTTMEDLKKLQKHIEKEFSFTGLQIAIHRDEGHFEHDKFITNNHAHLSFFTLEKNNGRQMFRREHINREKLRNLQTQIAKILNMDRGIDKRISLTQRLGHKEYKQKAKEEEKLKLNIKKEFLANQNDLKEEIKILREKLKENQAIRQDYSKLEQLNKDLKLQIKDKALNKGQLEQKIKALEIEILKQKKEKEHFKALNEEKGIEVIELKNQNKALIKQKKHFRR